MSAGTLACPRCRSALVRAPAGDVFVLVCGRCGGVMLDGAGSARIASLLDDAPLEAARDADAGATLTAVDTNAPAACPVCSGAMLRAPSPGTAVVVDTCGDHGTWFDHGEMILIVKAIAAQRGVPPPAAAADAGVAPHPASGWGAFAPVGSAVGEVAGNVVLEGVFGLIASIFG